MMNENTKILKIEEVYLEIVKIMMNLVKINNLEEIFLKIVKMMMIMIIDRIKINIYEKVQPLIIIEKRLINKKINNIEEVFLISIHIMINMIKSKMMFHLIMKLILFLHRN